MEKNCTCNCSNKSADKRYLDLKKFIDTLKGSEGIAMPVLQEAQRIFGYLPLEVQKFISENTGIPIAEIYGVSTFYSQFTITPVGKHQISVCLGTACYVKGAQKVVDKVADVLDVKIGGTTPDGLFTLNATRCLGCCGLAPVMMIDDDVYAKLDDIEVIPAILDKYKDKSVSVTQALTSHDNASDKSGDIEIIPAAADKKIDSIDKIAPVTMIDDNVFGKPEDIEFSPAILDKCRG